MVARTGASGSSGLTVRTRVLSTMLAFMAVGLLVSGGIAHIVQFQVLDDRVRADLDQEVRELERIATSRADAGEMGPETVDDLLRTVVESAAPSDNEAVLALVDGKPAYKPETQAFELTDPATVEQILAAYRDGETRVTTLEIDGREMQAIVASVRVEGDGTPGIFVVAIDGGVQRAEIWRGVGTYALAGGLTMLFAGAAGYLVSGRLLRPLGELREATGTVTAEDLVRRVDIPDTRDDVAALAVNFNRMLERIQEGVAEQRRFMSDVGHELRTPLTIVRGTLEMTDARDPADVRESHEIATEELDRMSVLVGDLSELAAASRPDFIIPTALSMRAFAASAFSRIERIGPRHWVLERTADVVAQADEQRLMQAVVQLAANAERYSAEGTRIALSVDTSRGPDGPEIHVSVSDEGVGIAPEDQERIFERFARADADRRGSGLGLAIVRAIAEGHGGHVRLRSALGEGSTFTLILPQHAEVPTADDSEVPLRGRRGRTMTA